MSRRSISPVEWAVLAAAVAAAVGAAYLFGSGQQENSTAVKNAGAQNRTRAPHGTLPVSQPPLAPAGADAGEGAAVGDIRAVSFGGVARIQRTAVARAPARSPCT